MIIPGVISCQSEVTATEVYGTKLLLNFETGDGTSPSADDTGLRTMTYHQSEVTHTESRFGNGSGMGTNTSAHIKTDFDLDLDVGDVFTFEFFGKNLHQSEIIQLQGSPVNHRIEVVLLWSSEDSKYYFRLRKWMQQGGAFEDDSGLYTSTEIEDEWWHIALTHDGAGNVKLWFEGSNIATLTTGGAIQSEQSQVHVRIETHDGGTEIKSYVDSMRFVKGTQLYTTTFTPPTSALETVAQYTYS